MADYLKIIGQAQKAGQMAASKKKAAKKAKPAKAKKPAGKPKPKKTAKPKAAATKRTAPKSKPKKVAPKPKKKPAQKKLTTAGARAQLGVRKQQRGVSKETPAVAGKKKPAGKNKQIPAHHRKGGDVSGYSRKGADVKAHWSAEERAAYERAMHGSKKGGHKKPRHKNPFGGGEMAVGLVGVTAGYLFAGGVDRFASTHALTTPTGAAGQGGSVDQPAQGQLYNVEAPSAPIWSSVKRIGGAVVSVGVPLIGAAFTKGMTRSFLQTVAFGATGRTLGKAAEDLTAKMSGKTVMGSRLYGPEIAAQLDLAKVTAQGAAALPAAAPVMLSGAPPMRQFGAAPCPDCAAKARAAARMPPPPPPTTGAPYVTPTQITPPSAPGPEKSVRQMVAEIAAASRTRHERMTMGDADFN